MSPQPPLTLYRYPNPIEHVSGYGIAGKRHPGPSQDAFWPSNVASHEQSGLGLLPERLTRFGRLYILSDGVTHSANGTLASQMAVQTIGERYYGRESNNYAANLRQSVIEAHTALARYDKTFYCWRKEKHPTGQTVKLPSYKLAKRNPPICPYCNEEMAGLQATLLAALVVDQRAYLVSVGDSRALIVRNGQPSPIFAPRKDEFLGMPEFEPEYMIQESVQLLAPNDQILLFSDGVTDVLKARYGEEVWDTRLVQMTKAEDPIPTFIRDLHSYRVDIPKNKLQDDITLLGITIPTPQVVIPNDSKSTRNAGMAADDTQPTQRVVATKTAPLEVSAIPDWVKMLGGVETFSEKIGQILKEIGDDEDWRDAFWQMRQLEMFHAKKINALDEAAHKRISGAICKLNAAELRSKLGKHYERLGMIVRDVALKLYSEGQKKVVRKYYSCLGERLGVDLSNLHKPTEFIQDQIVSIVHTGFLTDLPIERRDWDAVENKIQAIQQRLKPQQSFSVNKKAWETLYQEGDAAKELVTSSTGSFAAAHYYPLSEILTSLKIVIDCVRVYPEAIQFDPTDDRVARAEESADLLRKSVKSFETYTPDARQIPDELMRFCLQTLKLCELRILFADQRNLHKALRSLGFNREVLGNDAVEKYSRAVWGSYVKQALPTAPYKDWLTEWDGTIPTGLHNNPWLQGAQNLHRTFAFSDVFLRYRSLIAVPTSGIPQRDRQYIDQYEQQCWQAIWSKIAVLVEQIEIDDFTVENLATLAKDRNVEPDKAHDLIAIYPFIESLQRHKSKRPRAVDITKRAIEVYSYLRDAKTSEAIDTRRMLLEKAWEQLNLFITDTQARVRHSWEGQLKPIFGKDLDGSFAEAVYEVRRSFLGIDGEFRGGLDALTLAGRIISVDTKALDESDKMRVQRTKDKAVARAWEVLYDMLVGTNVLISEQKCLDICDLQINQQELSPNTWEKWDAIQKIITNLPPSMGATEIQKAWAVGTLPPLFAGQKVQSDLQQAYEKRVANVLKTTLSMALEPEKHRKETKDNYQWLSKERHSIHSEDFVWQAMLVILKFAASVLAEKVDYSEILLAVQHISTVIDRSGLANSFPSLKQEQKEFEKYWLQIAQGYGNKVQQREILKIMRERGLLYG